MNKPLSSDKQSRDFLQKKIPRSNKYSGVRRVVETGNSVTNVQERAELKSRVSIKQKPGDLFKRINSAGLAHLYLEEASHNDASEPESVGQGVEFDSPKKEKTVEEIAQSNRMGSLNIFDMQSSPYSKLEKNLVPQNKSPLTNRDGTVRSYLLLDMRDADEFEQGHVKSAMSYPVTHLSRINNYFSSEIIAFKNKEGKKIVVYAEKGDAVAVKNANRFVEKGCDNIYLLVGGFRAFAHEFPELVEGAMPPPPSPTPSERAAGCRGTSSVSGSSVRTSSRSLKFPENSTQRSISTASPHNKQPRPWK